MDTVVVSNVDPAFDESSLRQVMSQCGTVVSLEKQGGASTATDPQRYVVKYENAEMARSSLLFSGLTLFSKQISVNLAAVDGSTTSSAVSTSLPTDLATLSLGLPGSVLLPTPIITPTTPKIPTGLSGILLEPQYQSRCFHNSSNTQKPEEMARTIYVGNVHSKMTAERLVDFFSVCGPITFCRLAGDETHPARFAFIEFATLEGAYAAMQLNGTVLVDRAIKVNHSKNPIVKPASDEQSKVDRSTQDALSAAVRALNKKLGAAKDTEKAEGKEERVSSSGSHGRRGSRSRSRSPHRRRDRDRSSRRHSTSPRARHHHHRSRSRSRSRSRGRSPRRSHSSSHHRRKNRSESPDRKRRDR